MNILEQEEARENAKKGEVLDDGTCIIEGSSGNTYEQNEQNQSKRASVSMKWQGGKKVLQEERKEAESDLARAASSQKAIDAQGNADVAEGKKQGAGNALLFHSWKK
ncbi:MAG: hypothetical protein GY822_01740 [Deltaproteobacteria bacterium]|nr:hypothetical protein [Deltaproteobacteria bacterium]